MGRSGLVRGVVEIGVRVSGAGRWLDNLTMFLSHGCKCHKTDAPTSPAFPHFPLFGTGTTQRVGQRLSLASPPLRVLEGSAPLSCSPAVRWRGAASCTRGTGVRTAGRVRTGSSPGVQSAPTPRGSCSSCSRWRWCAPWALPCTCRRSASTWQASVLAWYVCLPPHCAHPSAVAPCIRVCHHDAPLPASQNSLATRRVRLQPKVTSSKHNAQQQGMLCLSPA